MTKEYAEDEDAIQQWIDEACDSDYTHRETTAELYKSWREWASERGEYVGSATFLGKALSAKGYQRWKNSISRGFIGIKPKSRSEEHANINEYAYGRYK